MKYPAFFLQNQVNKYILFLVGRVGSTYLNSLLESHPYIHAMGEKSLEFRDFNSQDQLKTTRKLLSPPILGRNKVIGFNVKLAHIKNLSGFTNILEREACKIIHLKRENRVKAVISFLNGKRLSEKTGMWGLFNESDRPSSFTVDLDEFDIALTRRERLDKELEDYIAQIQNQKIILSYEDMLENQDLFLNRVFTFLGVKPYPLKGYTLKITSDDLREVIINFDELETKYVGTQYESMFNEVIATSE